MNSASLPEALSARIAALYEAQPSLNALDKLERQGLEKVVACSEFAAGILRREPGLLMALLHSQSLANAYTEKDWIALRETTAEALQGVDKPSAQNLLRKLRQQEMLRILWRDFCGESNLDESLRDLSRLADICIQLAFEWGQHSLEQRFGHPCNAAGEKVAVVVVAMGKLGGEELNFSSDIDLIFFHEESGQTNGSRVLDNSDYCARLIRALIALLNEHTADGFVFRVDTRLRPFGDSGPMSMNFSQAEQYYLTHGREWERYAWIKARPVVGSAEAIQALMEFIQPFVYRRYLDYGVFAAIREMKALIDHEVRVSGEANNIKLGRGGIREIEFIAQAMQLVRAGQSPTLQDRRLLSTLQKLAEGDYLPEAATQELREAYIWLRHCENRLQAWADQQTHLIPENPEQLSALAYLMDCADGEALLKRWREVSETVRGHFELVFASDELEDNAECVSLRRLWQSDEVSEERLVLALTDIGLEDVEEVARRLSTLRNGSFYRGLPEQGRERLSQLLPQLFTHSLATERPEEAALRVLKVFEAIGGRTTYLTLLLENAEVLQRLIRLCAASPWITQMLAKQPFLLDELLDARNLERPASRDELKAEFQQFLQQADGDAELEMDVLRRFRQTNMLRVAASDVLQKLRLMIVSDHLSELAEVCINGALSLATEHVETRYGKAIAPDNHVADFGVIAFGKLGGLELGYGSDLDLVFLHSGAQGQTNGERVIDNQTYFTRLGQRLIHSIAQPTAAGVAYEVDMRLRPSGASGLLVSDFAVYQQYQQNKAWLWEHQALVRARFVAGAEALGQRFTALRQDILCQSRDLSAVGTEVANMRRRMRDSLEKREAGLFDLKQGLGGVTDIEFLVQHLLLSYASKFPELIEFTDNIRQLEALKGVGLLPEADEVAQAYKAYRRRRHALDLQQQAVMVPESEFTQERALLARLWSEHVECHAGE